MPRGKQKVDNELSLEEEELISLEDSQQENPKETPEEEQKENGTKTFFKEMPKLLLFSVDGTLENTTILIDGKKVSFSDFLLESNSKDGLLKLKYMRNIEITL